MRFITLVKNIVDSGDEDRKSEASDVSGRLSTRSPSLNLAPSDSSGSEFRKSSGSLNHSVIKKFG